MPRRVPCSSSRFLFAGYIGGITFRRRLTVARLRFRSISRISAYPCVAAVGEGTDKVRPRSVCFMVDAAILRAGAAVAAVAAVLATRVAAGTISIVITIGAFNIRVAVVAFKAVYVQVHVFGRRSHLRGRIKAQVPNHTRHDVPGNVYRLLVTFVPRQHLRAEARVAETGVGYPKSPGACTTNLAKPNSPARHSKTR